MDAPQFKIKVIAQELNARAHAHAIGALQTIRATLKGLRPAARAGYFQLTDDSWKLGRSSRWAH